MRHARITMKKRKAECYGNLVLFFRNMGKVYDKWQQVWAYEAKTPQVAGRIKSDWENRNKMPALLRGGR